MSVINNHKCAEKFVLLMTEILADSAQSTHSMAIELRKEKELHGKKGN